MLFTRISLAGTGDGFCPWHQLLQIIVFIPRQFFKYIYKISERIQSVRFCGLDQAENSCCRFCSGRCFAEQGVPFPVVSAVDFSFIYDLVEDKYSSDNGRPSIDPVMLTKIPIIQYMFGIKSMRQAVYVAIGIRLDGTKEVMGMWIGGNESAKYWLGVLNEIRNRGVEDIIIVSVDGLTGFVDAIGAAFPKAEVHRCIVHQIRYITKFVNYKDIKPFMKDLKAVYQAPTEEIALENLDILEGNWGKKYPSSIAPWRNNWTQLSTYFKYPAEIRKIIYTTNSIENFNRGLRKVTKSKSGFPTDDALFKSIYLAMVDITKKWSGTAWNWGQTLDQLMIYFGDRI